MDLSEFRKIQTSVTNFLYFGDEYLFLLRDINKSVDGNKLNGIGGKVEPGENYLDTAIRETKEETGYFVTPKDIKLSGIVRLEGGYVDDWIMCFFKIKVETKEIPLGSETPDGKLMWIHKNDVLKTEHKLVDDLKYVFPEVVNGQSIFFMNAKVNSDEKISVASLSKINN
jgi:8-oxo-dGTP pyrophosphatase MutT (NUDIX family)